MTATRPGHRRTALGALALAITVALGLAACASGSGTARPAAAGPPAAGGTAYFAEQPLSPPTYIFPLISGQYYTVANTSNLQTLLYLPLYWYGDRANTSIDYPLSIGNPPAYSDGNRVVTITLKHYLWSDGEAVSARDVGFWINLLKANKLNWASYVPGGFPDNVVSWRALGPTTIQLRLNASYNPFWFTYNELSQITPLPIAWDRTSLSGPAPAPAAAGLPDTTTAGAKAVYSFLNAQATRITGYASSPIWSVVDGPWKLVRLASFHGPSTTDQIGLEAYPVILVAWPFRKLYTAFAPAAVVSGRPTAAGAGAGRLRDVRSQAIGRGVIWDSSL